MYSKLLLLILASAIVQSTSAAKILLIFPFMSRSHFQVGEVLSLGLANAGHDVTLICQFPYKASLKNVEVVQLTGALEVEKGAVGKIISIYDYVVSPLVLMTTKYAPAIKLTNYTLQHPNTRKLMRTHKFDAIVIEQFCNEALLGLGPYFGAPTIAISTFGPSKWTSNLVGASSPPSHVPHITSSFSDRMSFWQRTINTLLTICEMTISNFIVHPSQRAIYNEVFPNAAVSYDDILRNVSMVLVNSHFSINAPHPSVPNLIEIGGMHVERKVKELPEKLKNFLNSATAGVIYFTFGSKIKGSLMSSRHRDTFVRVFSGLKQKVIWKYEETMPLTENILIDKWFPQNDILAHPNIKVFVTHGGLLGVIDAIYHAVPLIGIPIRGDQGRNIRVATESGWALTLDFHNITDESLGWALNEVLTNKKYTEAVKEVSRIHRDQLFTPLETAIYWIEYVIRYKGAPHLRSASVDLNFFRYHNIDVFALLLLGMVLIFLISAIIVRACCRNLYNGLIGSNKSTKAFEKKIGKKKI